jgi:hypoxanthine-DNA glycosylase
MEKHPFETFIPEGAQTLIIGTFPTARKYRRFNFYYPGARNKFWHIMSDIFGTKFLFTGKQTGMTEENADKAVKERKEFLQSKKIGITDMIETCERKNDSSNDNDLVPIEYRNIVCLLRNHPAIDKLIFTSRGGNSAFQLFRKQLKKENISLSQLSKENNILKGAIEYSKDRKIEILVPYSPSMRVYNAYGREFMTKMYKECLV